jgi:hypothetical protein
MLQQDGSIRIAWQADGFEAVVVRGRFRPRAELDAFARAVADTALLERRVADLAAALRAAFPGAFDLRTDQPIGGPWQVVITLHPPPGTPNPDPW